MPYNLPLPPHSLGQLDFTLPDMRAWLGVVRNRKQAVDIAHRPLILLGGGSVLAQPFVAGAIACGQAVALIDNAGSNHDSAGVPVAGDADLDALFAQNPDAIGVLCCNSKNALAHFKNLWGERGPLLSFFEIVCGWPDDRRAGQPFAFLSAFADEDHILNLHAHRPEFADTLSRQTFDALMLYRLTWDTGWLEHVNRPEKAIYFEPDVMPLSENEVFVDGGAYDGDTVRDFVAVTGGKYKHVHAFELDPANIAAFYVKTAGIDRLSLHTCGLWHEPAELKLEQHADNCSRISERGGLTVPLDALDNFDLGGVTLLKMDIEGAENEALAGASIIITRSKPKMAISIYHKFDDFLTIPAKLLAMRPDYVFKLRHYSQVIFDSVLYAT